MRTPEIEKFYSALHGTIADIKSKHACSFIIFVGDDSSSPLSSNHYSRIAASKMKEIAEKYQMVDLIDGLMTRGNSQPDSCFAFFDPEQVDITANLLAGMTATGADHEAIQIQVHKSKLIMTTKVT